MWTNDPSGRAATMVLRFPVIFSLSQQQQQQQTLFPFFKANINECSAGERTGTGKGYSE